MCFYNFKHRPIIAPPSSSTSRGEAGTIAAAAAGPGAEEVGDGTFIFTPPSRWPRTKKANNSLLQRSKHASLVRSTSQQLAFF